MSVKLHPVTGGQIDTLEPDDSFRTRAEPFGWSRSDDCPETAIWVIAPPVCRGGHEL
ncbi:MAG: hypothetical protein NXH74_10200 [Rhodobacteraceae bacterium]|nr:hypothetical protein [Paracoccaceae bacterium]